MKKKILSLVLATVLASSLLVACGDSGTSPDAPAASTPNAETPDATSADASLNNSTFAWLQSLQHLTLLLILL